MAGKKTDDSGNNTNLASEFLVLSILHRIGVNAVVTLSNKKAVDLVIEFLTIDING